MLTAIKALWRLPMAIHAEQARTQRALDDLTQAVRDLEATIKTAWTEDPAAKRPAKPRISGDPHGL